MIHCTVVGSLPKCPLGCNNLIRTGIDESNRHDQTGEIEDIGEMHEMDEMETPYENR